MRYLTMVIIFLVFNLYGCVAMPPTTPDYKTVEDSIPKINDERIAAMGDIFFQFIRLGGPYDPSNWKYELTVVELNKEKIGLMYSEYIYKLESGGWLIKEGFNKRFDFPTNDTIIRFKEYEFEILSLEQGQIRYKRIK